MPSSLWLMPQPRPARLAFMPEESTAHGKSIVGPRQEKNIGALMQKARHEGAHAHRLFLQGPADNAILEARSG